MSATWSPSCIAKGAPPAGLSVRAATAADAKAYNDANPSSTIEEGETCVIVGTPGTATTSPLGFQVFYRTEFSRVGSSTSNFVITISVLAPPNLANLSDTIFETGQEDSIVFANNGGGSITRCDVSPMLPMGLSAVPISGSSSCQISGTPLAASAQETYTVTARNAIGPDASPATVRITVGRVPSLADFPDVALATGEEANIVFVNNGSSSLTGCAVCPMLPTGLSASRTGDNTSCRITGATSVAQVQMTYTVTATNIHGPDPAPATVRITINEQGL